jgi:predicted ATPase
MRGISSITIERYRSFVRPTTIELRPLTLFFGRNSAGKSALLRLFPLLAASFGRGVSTPLNTDALAEPFAFGDLFWRGDRRRRVRVKLTGSGWSYDVDLSYDGDPPIGFIREWRAAFGGRSVSAEVVPEGPYDQWRLGGEGEPRQLTFDGLLPVPRATGPGMPPNSDPSGDLGPLWDVREQLAPLHGQVQWLRSTRARIRGPHTARGNRPSIVGSDGSGVMDVLLAHDDVMESVAAWYRRPEISRRLKLVPGPGDTWRLQLDPARGTVAGVGIEEVGEGMQQVLPVLTSIELARRVGRHMVAIEDPEALLHGDAQQALASHLCQVAGVDGAPTLVVETHSRVLLLGIQLAVANKEISSDKVAIYWVDQNDGSSMVYPVQVRGDGSLEGWPPGPFGEDLALAQQLARLRLRTAG